MIRRSHLQISNLNTKSLPSRLYETLSACVLLLAALSGCNSEPTMESWLEQLKSGDSVARYSAAKELGNYGEQAGKAVPELTNSLSDPDPMVRMGAAYALAKIGTRAAPSIPVLIKKLDDRDREVRLAAVYALAAMGPQARMALPALSGCARDRDAEVREEAKRAIEVIDLAQKYEAVHASQVPEIDP